MHEYVASFIDQGKISYKADASAGRTGYKLPLGEVPCL